MTTVLVLGATSTIAQATIHELGKQGMNLILTGRREDELKVFKQDLKIRYDIQVDYKLFDALDFDKHEEFFTEITEAHPTLDGVLLMYGPMTDQKEAESSFTASRQMIDVNYTSAVSILNIAANYFEARKKGFIGAVSHVAGERDRKRTRLNSSHASIQ